MKKHLLLIIFSLCLSYVCLAQEPTKAEIRAARQYQADIETIAKIKKKQIVRKELLAAPRSSIRAGIGFLSNVHLEPYVLGDGSVMGERSITGSQVVFSIDYSYRIVQFLELGAYVSYVNLARDKFYYMSGTGQIIGAPIAAQNTDLLNFSIFLRYNWFNSRWVSLYSSLGARLEVSMMNGWNGNPEQTISRTEFLTNVELVPIGVRVGRRLFGYFEPFAWSGRGSFALLGIGYKF